MPLSTSGPAGFFVDCELILGEEKGAKERETDRQTERDRWTDRETETNRERERQTDRKRERVEIIKHFSN